MGLDEFYGCWENLYMTYVIEKREVITQLFAFEEVKKHG
jgi:hypothetical protein